MGFAAPTGMHLLVSDAQDSTNQKPSSWPAPPSPIRRRRLRAWWKTTIEFFKLDGSEVALRGRIEQEWKDREMSEAEAQMMRLDLSRRIRDQKFAQDWEQCGDDVMLPSDEGSSTATIPLQTHETYRLINLKLV